MIRRCKSTNGRDFKNYAGKGISVCKEWYDVENFISWALNNGYSDDLTIDRIDSTKDYTPENCRWVDRKVQNNNTSRNHMITYKGRTQTMSQWCEEIKIPYDTLKSRLNKYGWSVERSFETPTKKQK